MVIYVLYSPYEKQKDEILPELIEQEILESQNIEKTQHFTKPPARYSEAKLIKEMEELGIGRPSTYAMIIDTIQTICFKFKNKINKFKKSFWKI